MKMYSEKPPEPGIYQDIPFDEYLQWQAVDASLIKVLQRSPAEAHAKLHGEGEDEDKSYYVLGRLFHLLSTQPELADGEFIVKPETYTNDKDEEKPWHAGAKVCKAMLANWAASGLTPVSSLQLTNAKGMAESLRHHPKFGPLLKLSQPEVSVVRRDAATGILCKGRWDAFPEGRGVVGDLKSESASLSDNSNGPFRFFGNAYKRGYHIQTAMYLDMMIDLCKFDNTPMFVFGCVENYAPWLCRCFAVYDDEQSQSYTFLDCGRKQYKAALLVYKQCTESGVWPRYDPEFIEMMLPAYVEKQEMQFGFS